MINLETYSLVVFYQKATKNLKTFYEIFKNHTPVFQRKFDIPS